jgi:methionyl-tRNA formyltransferase
VIVTELRVVIACQESAGVRALELVVERGHRVIAVLTDPRRDPTPSTGVAAAADRLGIEVRDAALVREPALASWLHAESVDLLLNVHSLHLAIGSVVEAPRIGSFNLHPGPLPGYPGLNAPSWGIYDRAPTFGCTVHWMDAGIDTGPIAYAGQFPIGDRDTGLTLTTRCARAGLPLLARVLDDAASGGAARIPRIEQEGERIDRGPGPPHEGRLPWALSADRIVAFVRACDYGPFPSPWGRVTATVGGVDVGVTRARAVAGELEQGDAPGRVLEIDGDDVLVVAGEETVLRISRLERGGVSLPAAEVVGCVTRFTD